MENNIDHIVANIQPFILKQNISVYHDGECIEVLQCNLDELEDTLYNLSKKYNIKRIDLAGNRAYASKVKDNIAVKKYECDHLTVSLY